MKSGFIKDEDTRQVGFFVVISLDEVLKHSKLGEWDQDALMKEAALETEIQVRRFLNNQNEKGVTVEKGVETWMRSSGPKSMAIIKLNKE